MYYFETYDFIIKILTNLYLDSTTTNIQKKDIIFSNIAYRYDLKEFASMLSGIIGTKIPLSLDSIKKNNKYMTNITLREYIYSLHNPEFNKEFSNKENIKDIDSSIISLFDNSDNPISIKSSNTFYRNTRDSILYLSDLDMINSDISMSKKSGLFSIDELRNLYSMTIRLILPKHMVNEIKCKNKLMYLYKDQNHMIHFLDPKSEANSISDSIHNMVIDYTKNGTRFLNLLTDDTLFTVYINATFKELSNIINTMTEKESAYNEQVIGAIYYHLVNFTHIKSLFNINPKVEENINTLIYRRETN